MSKKFARLRVAAFNLRSHFGEEGPAKAGWSFLIIRRLPNLWQVGMGPNVLVDWNADDGNKLTFPVGLGVNKTTVLFGKLPIRLGAEVHYSVVQPDDVGQTWIFRIYAVPVVPSPFAD